MSAADHKALWEPWGDLWNGNLALTEEIIAPDFVAHAAPITGTGSDEVHGRVGLQGWIQGIRAAIPDLHFTTQVGPLADGDFVAGRWAARGTYRGGMPGAAATAVGATVTFTGTDTLRVVNGQIAEYWANADSLYFMQQLGVVPTLG
jgi:predicted ester cyclase